MRRSSLFAVTGLPCLLLLAQCTDETPLPTSQIPRRTDSRAVPVGGPLATGNVTPTMSGVVVDALDGSPLEGIEVEVVGFDTMVTEADGSFSVPLSGSGSRTAFATFRGSSILERRTHLQSGAPTRAVVDVLPSDGNFDLNFFDHVFRDLGQGPTYRWTYEPTFEIWTKTAECRDGEFGECTDMFVTEDDAPGQFVSLAREIIISDTRKFTGGFVLGSQIETVTPTPGTVVPWRDYHQGGQIAVIFTRGYDASFVWPWAYETGPYYSASLHIGPFHRAIPFVYSHELAHTLGFFHPLGMENVPLRSVMRSYQDRPTRADELHGRILYQRPPGSRTPDTDPTDFVLNAARIQADFAPGRSAPGLSTVKRLR
jgi:hypothetical protein